MVFGHKNLDLTVTFRATRDESHPGYLMGPLQSDLRIVTFDVGIKEAPK